MAAWTKGLGSSTPAEQAEALSGVLQHVIMHGVVPGAVLERVLAVSVHMAWSGPISAGAARHAAQPHNAPGFAPHLLPTHYRSQKVMRTSWVSSNSRWKCAGRCRRGTQSCAAG